MSRRDKFLLGGVAVLSVGAIAVTPVAPNTVATQQAAQAKTLAYDLTAAMDATASPLEVYGALIENTVTNLEGLGGALLANPAPLLRQVLENQQGYAETTVGAFTGIPAAIERWYNGDDGKVLLDAAQAKLSDGDIAGAYQDFNKSLLYGLGTGLSAPLRAPGFIFSGVPRGETEYIAGIPEQIAQNFTNLIGASLSTDALAEVFQGVFAPISGAVFELSRIADAIGTSIGEGDIPAVVNALVNTPGVVANAVLNGFDYGDEDPGHTEWAGLIRYTPVRDRTHVNGLVQSVLINIPKALAGAIDNTPEVEAPEEDGVSPQTKRTVVSAQRLSADFAAPKAAIETPIKSAAPVELTDESELTSGSVEHDGSDAKALSVEQAATGEAQGNADKGKPSISERIKDRINEAKEARVKAKEDRQAKIKQAKEDRQAKVKESKAKTKESKAKPAKSGKSKGGSDS
ncbi:hypothetical protein FR943_23760 [Mycobacterium sp. TNTM28]|uniref:PE-PGRS family protein n=1 Tax=[Mycobacterium] fortunisiensis TaxID=2600579 RepID=A0ABS6KTD4_9MYCO|nr:hypothetical protein [[Mycobacterium] fortunisiensis]MBU9766846.1 hypothetical protein [[Mycobacterium] fortunisiensis]